MAVSPDEIRYAFSREFPGVAPVTQLLHEQFPEQWLRIHSLPGSRRYPRSVADRARILNRQGAILDVTIGLAEPCILLVYDWTGADSFPAQHPFAQLVPEGAKPVWQLPADDAELPPTSIYAVPTILDLAQLQSPLLAVADDRARFAIFSPQTGAFFAPYDGGADIFLRTTLERDALREAFVEWLSPDPSGL